jgi:inorganic pyrophosphatase
MNLQDIPLGRHAPSIINVVVEAPKGSRKKYRYHAKSRRFRLAYEFSIPVPTEYGWIPETIAEDGHFLNAMVIARHSSHPGYICEARPIGLLKRKDKDHHVICVLLGDERYTGVKDIFDLDVKSLKKIVQFFEPYFELSGWLNHTEAIDVVKTAHEKYIVKRDAHIADAQAGELSEDDVVSGNFDEVVEEANQVEEDSEWSEEFDEDEGEDADFNN